MMNEVESHFTKYISRYEKRHGTKYGTPLIMSFLVTNRCNLQCKHCFYHETIEHENAKLELSVDEYRKLSESMDYFLTGIFCGGEPFIREDFHEIIQIFQKNNKIMLADSASNGQLTNRIVTQVERILKASPYQAYSLGISIDGLQEEHELIRGHGTFEKLMQTWRELKILAKHYSNFELYICTTMNTLNENRLDEFVEWAHKSLDPAKIVLIKTRQSPRAGEGLKEIDINNYDKCLQIMNMHISELEEAKRRNPMTYLIPSINRYIYEGELCGKKLFHCYAGIHGGFVDYNGNVGVCEIMQSGGNLRNYDMNFGELWNSEKMSEIRKKVNCCLECERCTHESEGLLPSLFFSPNQIQTY